ncbi:UNVERIFIED_CONTAM: hypothetical protein Sradi_5701800 [Sesamum radiatum]|uniref:Uncharacterized protein n=1 Tax=Sesamum radiatum TaxID=300843 RepID=A0AAW2L1C0_SESRA
MGHLSQDFQVILNSINEDANFVSHGGKSNFNLYSNTNNPGWRNHLNFSWSNNQQQGPPGYQQPWQQPPQEKKSNLEDLLSNFITAANTLFQSQDASIRNLEVQLGQLVSIVSERKERQLSSDTEKNPREQANAITLKNGKTIGDEPPKEQIEEVQGQEGEETHDEIRGSPPKLNLHAIPYISHILSEFLRLTWISNLKFF